MADNCKMQISITFPIIGMVNVYANTAEEFRLHLTDALAVTQEKATTIKTMINDLKMSPAGLSGAMESSSCTHAGAKKVASGVNKKGPWDMEACDDCGKVRFINDKGVGEWLIKKKK